MAPRIGIAILAVTLSASVAVAAPVTRASLGNGYTLVVGQNGLHVAKGKQRARLGEAVSINKTKVDRKARRVEVEVEDYSCMMTHAYTWTFGQLDARLANTAAYGDYRKKRYKAAAAGFAKAIAADPAWNIPAYNLASARQLLGEDDAAVAALAPWLASRPVATYVQVTTDSELAPLLPRAEIQAVRAKRPGNVTLTRTGIGGGVAYAPGRKLVAVTRTEASWGACTFTTDLEIYDLATTKKIASTPLVHWRETSPECDANGGVILRRSRSAVDKRAAKLQAMLRELGFVTPKTESATRLRGSDGKDKGSFARARFGLVMLDGHARVLRKNTELGTGVVLEHLQAATYVPDANVVVVWSGRPGAEGCEGSDPTEVTLIALRSPV